MTLWSRGAASRVARYLLVGGLPGGLLTALPVLAADPYCPDIPLGPSQSVDYYITDRNTGASIGDGAVLPLRAFLNLDGVATANGGCLIGMRDCSQGPDRCFCTDGLFENRTVNHVSITEVIASQGSMSGTYSAGRFIGKDPTTGTTQYYNVVDSRDSSTSCCPGSAVLWEPGAYTFIYTNYINITYCQLLPDKVSATATVYAIDAVNDDCNAIVGKGIGLASRTASVSESDWTVESSTPVDFVRYYNSYAAGLPRDFGTWSHSYDVRVVAIGASLRKVIEPDGSMKLYRDLDGGGTLMAVAPRGERSHLTALASGGTARTMPDGTREEFNAAGLLVSRADRNGNATLLTRDSNNRLTQLTTPFGEIVFFESDTYNRITAITLPDGNRIAYTYSGQVLQKVTYADGTSRTYEHLGPGYAYLTGVKNEKGDYVRKYVYDSSGRVTQSSADGASEKTSIATSGCCGATVTDSLGRVTSYTLATDGGRNRVVAVSSPCGQCSAGVSNVYDANLNLIAQADALGNVTTFAYDGEGNLLTQTDGFGSLDESTTRFTYDPRGAVESIVDGEGGLYSYAYDGRGNLAAWADAQGYGGAISYDARGLPASVTDPAGYTTAFGWDDSGNMAWAVPPLGPTWSFSYDVMGRRLTSTFADRTTSYGYDARGRLTSIISPDGGSTTFEYDAAGYLRASTDALNNRTSRIYDKLGRPTEERERWPDHILV